METLIEKKNKKDETHMIISLNQQFLESFKKNVQIDFDYSP